MVTSDEEMKAQLEQLLGAESTDFSTDSDVEDEKVTGTFAEGSLTVEYATGQGTDSITWSKDGITAQWTAGMTAPEIVE